MCCASRRALGAWRGRAHVLEGTTAGTGGAGSTKGKERRRGRAGITGPRYSGKSAELRRAAESWCGAAMPDATRQQFLKHPDWGCRFLFFLSFLVSFADREGTATLRKPDFPGLWAV